MPHSSLLPPHTDHAATPPAPRFGSGAVGHVVCPPARPATPTTVWIALSTPEVALHDLLLIDGRSQQVLGTVVDIQVTDPTDPTDSAIRRPGDRTRTTLACLTLLGTSDGRQRPPQGTLVRHPTATEVSDLLAEVRQIPADQRVPLGVVPLPNGVAPLYGQVSRIVGPTTTSMLVTGAAGSSKSSAGLFLATSLQHTLAGQIALVVVNSKGSDFLFADYARAALPHADIRPLSARDQAIYQAMGFPQPPALQQTTVFVPQAHDATWRSVRPRDFPNTRPYQLSYATGLRYALSPTDDDEQASSVVTRQCIEEAAGPFTREQGITDLPSLITALDREVLALRGERQRWRNQFQATTLAAALRQLRTTDRDLGPLLGPTGAASTFPVADLAQGGAWVVDVAPLPQRAAQAVLDALINALWTAKTSGAIPHDLPLVLVVDELNRWSGTGPTARRLAAIVRDQRHKHFSLIGLAQQLSTLNPQLLANAETLWLGTTRSQELMQECYQHLPPHIRRQLHRLPPGQRVLDAWPLPVPLLMELPYPSWLVDDEGRVAVAAWREQQATPTASADVAPQWPA